MTERDNLPAVIAQKRLAVLSDKSGSLVGRGLAALRNDNAALYREARAVLDRSNVSGIRKWNAPAIFSTFDIFQKLADQAYSKAYYPLSILYHSKRHDTDIGNQGLSMMLHSRRYEILAFDWCSANQSNRDVELWCDLGEMYKKGIGVKVEPDYEQAAHWFRKAAEQEYPNGQIALGSMYKVGKGIEQNYEQAVYWLSKAAELGNPSGQWMLGEMYGDGFGVDQDDEQAAYWYSKAAEQGDAFRQYEVGNMYMKGVGVEQDYKQAVHWYRRAAEQGEGNGQRMLGEMYKGGFSVEQNYEQAVYWIRKAAEQGYPGGQYTLSLMYRDGVGVEQDDGQAEYWERKAMGK